MKDVDPNSNQERFQRILNSKIIPPTDVGFLLSRGVRKFRSFLLDQAGKVFADGAVDEPALEDVVQGLLLTFESNRIDSASTRAGIVMANQKLELASVAIVGLGGTGSFVLDQVVKTPRTVLSELVKRTQIG